MDRIYPQSCTKPQEFKQKLLKEHKEEGVSYWKLGKKYGIEASIIRAWGYSFDAFGDDGIASHAPNSFNYPTEMKENVVKEYLAGGILRICRRKKIQSRIKHRYNCCTRPASDPAYVAENILNRDFKADKPNEKWVTDVTEFKYGAGDEERKGKIYLSAIIDLYDKRPVAYVYGNSNDNPPVFNTFDKAISLNPGATPIFHSDRGYQYTSKAFRQKIIDVGMTQNMSRIAHCLDNGPMEGFWGIMKREMYYGEQYRTKEQLMEAIDTYMDYYTNKRVQRGLGILTPMEFHNRFMKMAE